MRMDVSHNFGDIGKRLATLRADLADKVMARTLNKVAEGAKGKMATAISEEFNVKKGEVTQNLRVGKASFKAGRLFLQAELAAPSGKKGRGFNLIRFVSGPRIKGGWGKRQLKFKIKRTGGTVTIPGAFIGSQGRTVFIRTGEAKSKAKKGFHEGKKREPIKGLSTVDFPQMFNTRRVNGKVIAYIKDRLPIVMQQELNNVLRQQR